uniref:Major facilitator superfamily (MFS) profile domain-containing protein n=1 Tax=Kryptolebias marmoratus TaxID=37003 RepID=A0A3Q3A1L1_KRYMA
VRVEPGPRLNEKGFVADRTGLDLFKRKGLVSVFQPQQGIGRPSVYHAVVVIFLEFFAWGLLTTPMLTVLHETFPQHTFLMNGLIQGVKGLLSFMSAPLIGALSDVWGRRSFLLITVFFTCAPIPLMRLSPWYAAAAPRAPHSVRVRIFTCVCVLLASPRLPGGTSP